MPRPRMCLAAVTAVAVALSLGLVAAPVEAQLIPLPVPLIPGLIGPPPAAPAPAPAVAPAAPKAPAQTGTKPAAAASAKLAQAKKAAQEGSSGASAIASSFRDPLIVRTGPSSSASLVAATGSLAGNGMSAQEAIILVGPPFPVAGMAKYTDDFLTPRLVPYPHLHQGTDIFADFGTPIVASGPGKVVSRDDSAVGGLEMWVAGDDGVNYYYAHLLSFGDTAKPGSPVGAGTVLGYVGNSGDASGGPPHLHFEIHPRTAPDKTEAAGVPIAGDPASASGAINPKPVLDAWLAMATQHAQLLVARNAHAAGPGAVGPPEDATLAGRTGKPAELVWFSVFEPALGSLSLAGQAAASGGVSPSPEAVRAAAAAAADAQRRAEIAQAVRTPYERLAELTNEPPNSAISLLLDLSP